MLRRAALSAAVAAALASGVAGAAPPAASAIAPPAPPPVVPPRLVGPARVTYPDGAEGEAVVVLELVVGIDGSVTEARAVSGEEPFASRAVEAARSFRFDPARRGDVAVAARIRFEVRFVPPAPPPPSDAPPPPAPPAGPAPAGGAPPPAPAPPVAPPPPPLEIDVEGDRLPAGVSSFGRAEIRELPGAFGDPFRAVEALPGVTPILSGVPYFFVRGAPPGNVGYFLDGVRVPLLFHVGLGPGVIHPALVERVDLYPGGYPARHGRFAGGIVSGETAAPAYELGGEASIRLVDSGAMVEAPFGDGRGSAQVAGRYSYTAALLTLISPEAVLEYWDWQTRVSWQLGPRDELSAFGFGAFDLVGERRDGRVEVGLGTEFHRLDLRWAHELGPESRVRLALTGGWDRTRAGDSDSFAVIDRMVGARAAWERRASPTTTLRAGGDVVMDDYSIEVVDARGDSTGEDDERVEDLLPTRTDLVTGAWGEVEARVAPRVVVTPGLRVDLYSSGGRTAALAVEPRVAARYELRPDLRTIYAVGIAHQPPSFVIPVPGFDLGALEEGLQRSLQTSAGVELDLPAELTSSVTLFQNAFFEMTDALGTAADDSGEEEDPGSPTREESPLLRRSLGHSYGLELTVRRPLTRRVGGFLSYTLSRSTRSVGRESFPSAFDRTHVLNVAAGYDLGRRWRLGGRLVFYTGFPAQSASPGGRRSSSPRRVPPFHRIDVRLEKRWRLGERGYWAFVFEVLNATLQEEAIDVSCESGRCEAERIGPVTVPSLGVEARF